MLNFFYLIVFSLFFVLSNTAQAAFIRDTEIEHAISQIYEPILNAAAIEPSRIQMHIVHDPDVNAFVTGGNHVLIHTGLILASEEPHMLAGVLAHETGHIIGGHLVRGKQKAETLNIQMAAGYILGVAAAVLGSPEAGQAVMLGSQHVAERNLLKHSREHEKAADQVALELLDKAGYSAKGLVDLFNIIQQNQRLLTDKINPYTITHPLTQERISHISHHIEQQKQQQQPGIPMALQVFYQRSYNKLRAFLEPAEKTFERYPDNNQEENARYSRAIAYYKLAQLDKSLHELDSLIEEQPENPYFHELKGQILFENGKVKESLGSYDKANMLLADQPLIRMQYAVAQLATEEAQYLDQSIELLEFVTLKEKHNSFAWRQLAIAYGRKGDIGLSYVALAEEALLQNNHENTRKFIKLAKKNLPEHANALIRVADIEQALKHR